jgi:hypothetical protein
MSGDTGKRLKTALGETRLLILGAQILFGFHLNAAFQQGFSELGPDLRWLHAFAFLNMAAAIALLIAPSLQHRIVEHGRTSGRIVRVTSCFADWALLPFAIGFGSDITIVVSHRFGSIGIWIGGGATVVALMLWYGAEWLLRARRRTSGIDMTESTMTSAEDTPLDQRIEHMLTEARVLIPGGQALLGFQLAIMLTETFARLPQTSKIIHVAALCSIALTVMLLMAPAAFHRIAYLGRDSEEFHRLGSALVVASAVPLALGITGDLYIAITLALGSVLAGALSAAAAAIALFTLWFAVPLALRRRFARW